MRKFRWFRKETAVMTALVLALSFTAAAQESTEAGTEAEVDVEDPVRSEALADMPQTFTLTSGVGAWSCELTLAQDGTFIGRYTDSNMGEDTENYAGGTVYVSDFEGSFTDFEKIDDYTYSMKLGTLEYARTAEEDWVQDDIHFVPAEAAGIEGGDEFIFYLPGHTTEDLPEGFMTWANLYIGYYADGVMPETLGIYGIYNVSGEYGFGTELESEADSAAAAAETEAETEAE